MADKLTKSELDDLKAAGYVEGNPNTIPANVSPVLRSKAIEQWAKDNDADALDLPTAVDRGNALARERAEGDKFSAFDRDGDGKPGGSLPKGKRAAKK